MYDQTKHDQTKHDQTKHDQTQRDQITRRTFSTAAATAVLSGFTFSRSTLAKEVELPPLKVSERIPNFNFNDREGKRTNLLEFASGRLTLIEFWAPSCGPCLKELEDLKETLPHLKGKTFRDPQSGEIIGNDFLLVAISLNNLGNDAERWPKLIEEKEALRNAFNLSVKNDDIVDAFKKRFRFIGTPTSVLVDNQLRVIAGSRVDKRSWDNASLHLTLKSKGYIKE